MNAPNHMPMTSADEDPRQRAVRELHNALAHVRVAIVGLPDSGLGSRCPLCDYSWFAQDAVLLGHVDGCPLGVLPQEITRALHELGRSLQVSDTGKPCWRHFKIINPKICTNTWCLYHPENANSR